MKMSSKFVGYSWDTLIEKCTALKAYIRKEKCHLF